MDRATHFRLLELPPELRNHIYDYVFSEPVVVQATPDKCPYTRPPGLSLANKQLCRETIKLFGSRSTFEAPLFTRLQRWLAAMPADRRASLGAVRWTIRRPACEVLGTNMRPRREGDWGWGFIMTLDTSGATLRPKQFVVGFDDRDENYAGSVLKDQTR